MSYKKIILIVLTSLVMYQNGMLSASEEQEIASTKEETTYTSIDCDQKQNRDLKKKILIVSKMAAATAVAWLGISMIIKRDICKVLELDPILGPGIKARGGFSYKDWCYIDLLDIVGSGIMGIACVTVPACLLLLDDLYTRSYRCP